MCIIPLILIGTLLTFLVGMLLTLLIPFVINITGELMKIGGWSDSKLANKMADADYEEMSTAIGGGMLRFANYILNPFLWAKRVYNIFQSKPSELDKLIEEEKK